MCYLYMNMVRKTQVRSTKRLSLEIGDVAKGQLPVPLAKALIKSLLTSQVY